MRLLAIARLGLHKPRWLIIDEALDTLEDDAYRKVMTFLDQEMGKAAIVNIGRRERANGFFTRVLELEKDAAGGSLRLIRPKSLRPTNPQLVD